MASPALPGAEAFASLAPLPLIAEHERLLQLRTALPALWLVPEEMRLYEALGEVFTLIPWQWDEKQSA